MRLRPLKWVITMSRIFLYKVNKDATELLKIK